MHQVKIRVQGTVGTACPTRKSTTKKTEKDLCCDGKQFEQEKINMKKYVCTFTLLVIVLVHCSTSVLDGRSCQAENPGNTIIQFHDPKFEVAVREVIGKPDGEILASDVVEISELNVSNRDIVDLEGIEYFSSLKILNCSGNKLTRLSVSNNAALIELTCYGNELVELEISGATALEKLNCWDNQLATLNTTKNLALEQFSCNGNQLAMLDVRQNAELKELYCEYNQLTKLELGENTALAYLNCTANRLNALDISGCVALKVLRCSSNELTTLDTKKNIVLTRLYCSDNQLTSLDMSNNVELWSLICYKNRLQYLNLQGLTALEMVNWDDNLFSDISSITQPDEESPMFMVLGPQGKSDYKVTEISPKEGSINDVAVEFPDPNFETEIRKILGNPTGDIMTSDVQDITRLIVSGLDIKDLTGLEHFVALEELDCKRNLLTRIDIHRNTMLKSLDCSWNQLEMLDVSSNPSLERLSCENNRLASLDLTKNTALSMLCCYNNLFPDDSAIAASETANFTNGFVTTYDDLM